MFASGSWQLIVHELLLLFVAYRRCENPVLVVGWDRMFGNIWAKLKLHVFNKMLIIHTSLTRSSMMRMAWPSLYRCKLLGVYWILNAFIVFTCFLWISSFSEIRRSSDFIINCYFCLRTNWWYALRVWGTKLLHLLFAHLVKLRCVLFLEIKVLRPR